MESPTPTAEALKPTPASQWKSKLEIAGTDLVLPSGNVARVRRLSPTAFLNQEIIPDPLSEIIRKAIHSKQGLPPDKIKEMSDDPEKIQASLELFDRVLAAVMVLPPVQMPPTCVHPMENGSKKMDGIQVCGEYYNVDKRHADAHHEDYHSYMEGPRHPDILYADTVDVADKMYVFEFAIKGTADLESFRQRLTTGLGNLFDVQDVPVSPKRTA